MPIEKHWRYLRNQVGPSMTWEPTSDLPFDNSMALIHRKGEQPATTRRHPGSGRVDGWQAGESGVDPESLPLSQSDVTRMVGLDTSDITPYQDYGGTLEYSVPFDRIIVWHIKDSRSVPYGLAAMAGESRRRYWHMVGASDHAGYVPAAPSSEFSVSLTFAWSSLGDNARS